VLDADGDADVALQDGDRIAAQVRLLADAGPRLAAHPLQQGPGDPAGHRLDLHAGPVADRGVLAHPHPEERQRAVTGERTRRPERAAERGADLLRGQQRDRVRVGRCHRGGRDRGRQHRGDLQRQLRRAAAPVPGRAEPLRVPDHLEAEPAPPGGCLRPVPARQRRRRHHPADRQAGHPVVHPPLVPGQPGRRPAADPAHGALRLRPQLLELDEVTGGQVEQGGRDRVGGHPPLAGQQVDHGRRLGAEVEGARPGGHRARSGGRGQHGQHQQPAASSPA